MIRVHEAPQQALQNASAVFCVLGKKMSVIIVITLEENDDDDYSKLATNSNFLNGAISKMKLSFCMTSSIYRSLDNNMATRRKIETIPENTAVTESKEREIDETYQGSTKNAVIVVAVVFFASLCMLAWLYQSFPPLEESEKVFIKLPRDMNDAKHIGRILDRYKEQYYIEVVASVFLTYIFLQTFAIPGSIFLSMLSGFLFPFSLALALVCFCSATGASLCYLLSSVVGRKLVHKYFPDRAAQWATTVAKHKDSLLNYIIFLRITPFLPNWFINIAAPCIDVPLFPFWLGTLIGVAPPSIFVIQAGKALHQLSEPNASWSWTSGLLLAGCAIISVIPVFFKNQLRRKFE